MQLPATRDAAVAVPAAEPAASTCISPSTACDDSSIRTCAPAHRLAKQYLVAGGQPKSAVYQYRICTTDLDRYENRSPSELTKNLYEHLIETSICL